MIKNKFKNSISSQLLKVVLTIYIIITIVMLMLHITAEYTYTKNSIQKEIRDLEKTFKQPLSKAIWNFDVEQRKSLLNSIYNLKFVSGVDLLSKDGVAIDELGNKHFEDELADSFELTYTFQKKDEILATLKIYTKPDIIFERMQVGLGFIIFNIVIKSLILLVLLMWAFNKYLARPILELTKKLEDVDLNNVNSYELFKQNKDASKENELELFSRSFSLMLRKIHNTIKELDILNKELDKKVQLRTLELHNEKQYIQKILDRSPNIIIVTDGSYILKANQRFFEFTNYQTIEEFKKEHDCICDYFTSLDTKKFSKDEQIEGLNWCNYLANNNSTTHIVELLQNKEVYLFSIVVDYLDSEKEMLITMQDITEIRRKDELLLEQSKLASMGEMIGNIAHQWRQPLSVISTSATGIQVQKQFGLLTDEILEHSCNTINDNTQYLSKTIDDFRNFIKGDRKKINFFLYDSLESFLHLLESIIKNNNINIILNVDKNIKIYGYENELIQCLVNIFNNAKDVLESIEYDSRYFIISAVIEKENVIIKLTDSGGGISSDVIDKIFEPYFTTKHQSQGTGLGLHMTYKIIVEGMQGLLEVKNKTFEQNDKTHSGAEFSITLPLSV
jgi:signal transduction histidine kinase